MSLRRIDVHRAVERGDVAVLTRYLDAGGDPEKKDAEYGAAPLHWASLRGRVEALSLLLDHGADVESRTGTDGTPLVWGCMGGDAQVVRLLLEQGASISAVTKGKGTALHHATHSGHPEVVAMLLEKGADPRAQDNRGERPGDKFDPEVTEGVKRSITQALAKAREERPSARRSSSLRSKRSSDKNRGDATDRSRRRASLSDKKNGNANGSNGRNPGAGNDTDHKRNNDGDGGGDDKSSTISRRVSATRSDSSVARCAAEAFASGSLLPDPRSAWLNEDDSLSAAAAAIAAAAWTPVLRKEEKNTERSSGRRSCQRTSNGTNGSVSGGREEGKGMGGGGVARANGGTPAAVPSGAAPIYPHSSREVIPRRSLDGDGDVNRNATLSRGDTAVAETTRRELFASPKEARALVPVKAESAELERLRRQVEDLTGAVAAAESREAEGRALMRQALADIDKRAEEAQRAGEARLAKVNSVVLALEQRSGERDKQVEQLNARLEDQASRLLQGEREAAALRSHIHDLNNGMIVLRKCLDGPSTEATATAVPPPRPPDDQQASAPTSYQRTRLTPTLSPTAEESLQQTASLVQRERAGTGRVFLSGGGGWTWGDRRSTTGAAATGLGGTTSVGGEGSREGVPGLKRSSTWRARAPATAKRQPALAAVVEDHDRLGSLYSMIARR